MEGWGMRNRRDFLKQTMACGAMLWNPARAWGQDQANHAAKALRILVLGGTGAIGPFHVRAAVERGHRVAVCSRGRRRADLPASVELLVGDRNGDLQSVQNREWDSVIDIATFGPGWVRSLGEAL